jgi:hypothetical protein
MFGIDFSVVFLLSLHEEIQFPCKTLDMKKGTLILDSLLGIRSGPAIL